MSDGLRTTASGVDTGLGGRPMTDGADVRWDATARAVAVVTVVELRRYLSNRISLFSALLLPLLLVLVIGLAYGAATPGEVSVAVVDRDGTAGSREFTAAVDDDPLLRVVSYDDAAAAARDVRLGMVTAALTVPDGFAEAVRAGQATVQVAVDAASTNAASVGASVRSAAERFGQGRAVTDAALAALGRSDDQARVVVEGIVDGRSEVEPAATVTTVEVGTLRPSDVNAYARAVPTQLTLFIFLNGMLAASTLVESRRLGVTRRVLSARMGLGPYLVGLGLSRFLLGLAQAVVLLVVGSLALGVDFGHTGAVAALVVVWCALGAAVGLLLGAVARTPEQVTAMSVPLGIGLAMLGGCMWPLSVVPPFMQFIGHLTPHAWAAQAWTAVIDDGAGLTDIVTELAVLVAVTAACLALAVVGLRRVVRA